MDIFIAERSIPDDTGRLRRFLYFLTVDTVDTGRFCFEDYGVRVTEPEVASVRVPSLTTSAVRIDELLTTLVDHLVGPAGLEDVVADWL